MSWAPPPPAFDPPSMVSRPIKPVYVPPPAEPEPEPESEPEPAAIESEPAAIEEEYVRPAARPPSQVRVAQPVAAGDGDEAAASRSRMVMILGGIILVQALAIGWLWTRSPATAGAIPSGSGELVVQSRPPGARVSIDKKEVGTTPYKGALPAGTYSLQVRVGNGEPRVIPLTIRPNVQTAQYVELQNVPTTGALDIRSEPRGARVMIDGQNRGTTPVVVKDLPPGQHEVVLDLNGRQAKQTVKVDAGATAQLSVPIK